MTQALAIDHSPASFAYYCRLDIDNTELYVILNTMHLLLVILFHGSDARVFLFFFNVAELNSVKMLLTVAGLVFVHFSGINSH